MSSYQKILALVCAVGTERRQLMWLTLGRTSEPRYTPCAGAYDPTHPDCGMGA